MTKKTLKQPKNLMGALVDSFIQDLDTDIDAQVRRLSLAEYGEWLTEFRAAVISIIDARIAAQKEDAG